MSKTCCGQLAATIFFHSPYGFFPVGPWLTRLWARILPSVSVSMTPTLLLTPKSTSSPGIVTSTGVKESWNSHRSGRTVSESSIWKKLFSFPEFRPSSLFKWDLGKGSFLKVLLSIEFSIDLVQDCIEEESHILSLRRSTRFLEKASVFINFGCRLEAWQHLALAWAGSDEFVDT